MCLAPHLTRCLRSKFLNDYCGSQPLTIPGTSLLNHLACPSASYHAIICLCIILMSMFSFFGAFPHKNLQMWNLATIVDFAIYSQNFLLYSQSFESTVIDLSLYSQTFESTLFLLAWDRYLWFHSSDLSGLDIAKTTRIRELL